MPDLNFEITSVEPAANGLSPLLHFKLRITLAQHAQRVQALLLNAQIQLQPPQRSYSVQEKERLVELFGPPEMWGQSLRNKLWAHSNATVGAFDNIAETVLPVPCTFDLNVAATKYFYALNDGDIPLLFLFSGSMFYAGADGRLQVERISWDKECGYKMPARQWHDLMERHFPNSAWLSLRRDVFDDLCEFKRRNGFESWERAVDELLRLSRREDALNRQTKNAGSYDLLSEVPA